MAQGNTVELAKKGDASAIATLMNKSLRNKGVAAEAVRSGNFLEITLHSQRALNQKAMLEIVQKGMKNLQVAAIERVLVRSQTGNTPSWESEFSLSEHTSETSSATPPTEPEISPQNPTLSAPVQAIQTPALHVSSDQPSGMVLLPKLSQVNRSLQQYQDIIVRLTDDSGSQIICLCTLAELIQSLHMPNAQLQHIADAIAKCSSVNADGERIISNVSILQPGQAWQKTQIRCVLQVFFEMGASGNIDLGVAPEPTRDTAAETMIDVHSQAEETQIEVPDSKPASESEVHDTVIETTEAIAASEETMIEVHRGTANKTDETQIEAVSLSQAPPSVDSFDSLGNQPSSQPMEETSEPLFSEFVFSMMAPVKSVTDIDTISDPAFPTPPEDNLSLTLDEFSRDLLAGVG